MVELSKRRAREAGLQERATFEKADIFEMDFSRATVITMYLLPELNLKLRPKILQLKPGTRVASHDFLMGDWKPDETSRMGTSSVHLWIVPADVGGQWQLLLPGQSTLELTMDQTFQQFAGKANLDKMETTLRETQLLGDAVQFAFTDERGVLLRFRGKVSADRIEGTFDAGDVRGQPFTARREGKKAASLTGAIPYRADEVQSLDTQ
ncbi:class I SAM-dependent methyltransferase [Diaphorobacter aerolatus]|uniref:Class I SAM-dependent methyltransferase n=1 Tax=Diaphorobacter aerolatus TaxID=1288495 RepID=A0A7H0GI13_9BURK|nr:class I SAM-dependent methyltransferase [Diaphorobacter aerolatus]QNP47929.1 class I SAM-dependent methyltransferase [Diaphorobacter aerolatus]